MYLFERLAVGSRSVVFKQDVDFKKTQQNRDVMQNKKRKSQKSNVRQADKEKLQKESDKQ